MHSTSRDTSPANVPRRADAGPETRDVGSDSGRLADAASKLPPDLIRLIGSSGSSFTHRFPFGPQQIR